MGEPSNFKITDSHARQTSNDYVPSNDSISLGMLGLSQEVTGIPNYLNMTMNTSRSNSNSPRFQSQYNLS